jgi:GYF domain 2
MFWSLEKEWNEDGSLGVRASRAPCSASPRTHNAPSKTWVMDFFVLVNGQQQGPFGLKNLHEMAALGSFDDEALVWCPKTNSWMPLKAYLLSHQVPGAGDSKNGRDKKERKPSAILGFLGALLAGVAGGGIISGVGILTGGFFPILWWAMAWGCGEAAKACGRSNGQLMGLFAFVTTFVGIMISCTCLDHGHPVIILGALGMLISLPGSLWLAFRTGSAP